MNLGIDIIDAIQKRYASFSDDKEAEDLYLFGTGHQKVVIEAVGFDKVQEKQRYDLQFCQLCFLQVSTILSIVLSLEDIFYAGNRKISSCYLQVCLLSAFREGKISWFVTI